MCQINTNKSINLTYYKKMARESNRLSPWIETTDLLLIESVPASLSQLENKHLFFSVV